jgi:hydroxylysine kinase
VHGIPGFEGDEVVAGTPLTDDEAREIAGEHYQLHVTQTQRFETERDDTFRVDAAEGTFILKVANPADSLDALDFETKALEYASAKDASLPLPRVLPSADGELVESLANGRWARLLTWLPGEPLADQRPTDDNAWELGRTLGHLTNALAGFEHPAAHRAFAWDALSFPRLAAVNEDVGTASTSRVFELFEERVAPLLDELPRHVIHNDFNPGNVLVEPAGARYVTGIIDFGDTIHTARVCDLSVALSYQLFPFGRAWDDLDPFIEAYDAVVPLTDAERQVMPALVAVRLAQRILIYQWMQRGTPESLDFGTQGNLAALECLLKETA